VARCPFPYPILPHWWGDALRASAPAARLLRRLQSPSRLSLRLVRREAHPPGSGSGAARDSSLFLGFTGAMPAAAASSAAAAAAGTGSAGAGAGTGSSLAGGGSSLLAQQHSRHTGVINNSDAKVANRDLGFRVGTLTGPLRDARRFPSTRWYPVPRATRTTLGFGICPSFKDHSLSRRAKP
jgi:hypothetical protein